MNLAVVRRAFGDVLEIVVQLPSDCFCQRQGEIVERINPETADLIIVLFCFFARACLRASSKPGDDFVCDNRLGICNITTCNYACQVLC